MHTDEQATAEQEREQHAYETGQDGHLLPNAPDGPAQQDQITAAGPGEQTDVPAHIVVDNQRADAEANIVGRFPDLELEMPPGFRNGEHGLERCVVARSGQEEWVVVCSPIRVVAQVRSFESRSWSLLVELEDPDRKVHRVRLPRSLLIDSAARCRELLCDRGLVMPATGEARGALSLFLSAPGPRARVVLVETTGWHGSAFVLPDMTFGAPAGEVVQLDGGSVRHTYNQRGTLAEWQEMVCQIAGNSRIVLALCVAMAGPLLKLVNGESGGIHLVGPSSTGKTTALYLAGSFFGGDDTRGGVTSWRTTDNALEAIARNHNDTSIMLDEIGQADARAVAAVSYMLTNGQGKSRSARDSTLRQTATWRLTFVSTGEVKLGEKIAESGGRAFAGQEVRVLDIPLPDAGMGIFERLPAGFETPAAFARYLAEQARRTYGVACRPYLDAITTDQAGVAELVRQFIDRFVADRCPRDADGQVFRVAERFGLYAAAGELGVTMGIIPLAEGEATTAAAMGFQSWLDNRGGSNAGEVLKGVAQVKENLARFGHRNFDLLHRAPGGSYVESRAADRWGVRTIAGGQTEYWATAAGFARLCDGYDTKAVAKRLLELGILKPGPGGKTSAPMNVPGEPKTRYYRLVLDGAGEPEANSDGN